MRAFVIRDSDGRLMYYGHVENKTSLMDGITPKPGYSLLPDSTPPPNESWLEPVWDGSQWQPGPADTAAATEETNRETLIANGKAALDNWASLSLSDKDKILKALVRLAVNRLEATT